MRDLDSAVGRLDNILISVYVIVAVLIIAVALVCLSWLIITRKEPLMTVCFFVGSTAGRPGHRRWYPHSWSAVFAFPPLACDA